MPMPKVAPNTMEETKSSVALVSRYVSSPYSALLIGPRMESVPMQNSMMAVESPWANSLPFFERLETAFLKRFSRSSAVPITAPIAMLAMNRTGYELCGMFCTTAFSPMPTVAIPRAVKMASWYFGFKPFLAMLPMVLPNRMQQVLTMVPSMYAPKRIAIQRYRLRKLRARASC